MISKPVHEANRQVAPSTPIVTDSWYACVIFDCDGVLVDSEMLAANVVSSMLAEQGVPSAPADVLAMIRGRQVATWVAELGLRHSGAVGPHFVSDFRSGCTQLFDRELLAVPGVQAVLSGLTVPFCTASSAPRTKIEHSLGLTGLLAYFTGRIFSAYEVGSWKPDPGLFLRAAADMGTPPANCAVVEDSLVGVQAGIAAGMTVFGYAPGETATALAAAGARTFTSMAELPELLRVAPTAVGGTEPGSTGDGADNEAPRPRPG